MAQIVMIAAGTLRVGVNNIGDVVDVYDDNVELDEAYRDFTVLKVSGTAAQVKAALRAKLPKFKTAHQLPLKGWTLDEPTAVDWSSGQRIAEQPVWSDDGGVTWKIIDKRPKYGIRITDVNGVTLKNLDKKCEANLRLDQANNLTEFSALAMWELGK